MCKGRRRWLSWLKKERKLIFSPSFCSFWPRTRSSTNLCTVVGVTVDVSKVQCCKEQYRMGTWYVRSMNQDKLEVVKQEMARLNIDSLGISELK